MDSRGAMKADPGVVVNLPHDGMIGTAVSPNAPAKSDMGYFTGDLSNYTKFVFLPKEWEGECVGLQIDGAMLNATVEVNGKMVGTISATTSLDAYTKAAEQIRTFALDRGEWL